MPTTRPHFAGTTWRFFGTYYIDGAATSLATANIKATLKRDVDDADASAVAQITKISSGNGQITLQTADGVANAGWIANFTPAATAGLIASLPIDDLYFDVRVQEADSDEWIPTPNNPDDPNRIPVRMPTTRSS